MGPSKLRKSTISKPSFSELSQMISDSHNMGKYLKRVGAFFRILVSFSSYVPLNLAQTAFSRGFLKALDQSRKVGARIGW